MWVILPPAARQSLHDVGSGLLMLKVEVRGENGVIEKVKRKMKIEGLG
jgi:hypothetical protein